jgi:ABC-type sugar transport system substrate-binding protein
MEHRKGPMRRTIAVSAALACALNLAACGATGGEPAATASATGKGYKLGFSFGLDDTPIYGLVVGPARKRAGQLGVSLIEGSAKSKCEAQVADMENMIVTGARAVTFLGLCGDGAAYNKVVRDGKAKGVTMVSYAFQHPEADGSITFNDEGAGQDLAADALAWIDEKFGTTYDNFSWGLISCSFAPPSIQKRSTIPKKEITAKTGKAPLEKDCANDPKTAQETVETWLAKDPGLDMVLAHVDSAALGAYQAFKQKGAKPGSVYVGGVDGQREAVDLLATGGDGIYQFSAALPLTGPIMVDIPNNIITGSGPASVRLNYTPLTADHPQAAKNWITKEFEPWR